MIIEAQAKAMQITITCFTIYCLNTEK